MKKAPTHRAVSNQLSAPFALEKDTKKYLALAKIYGILLKFVEKEELSQASQNEQKASAPLQNNIPS